MNKHTKHTKPKLCGLAHESNDEVARAVSLINQNVADRTIQDNGATMGINVVFHVMFPLNYQINNPDVILATQDTGAILAALNRDYNNNANVATGDMTSSRYLSTNKAPTLAQYKAMLALSKSANIKFSCVDVICANLKSALANDTNTAAKDIVIKGKNGSPAQNPSTCLNIWLVKNLGGQLLGYSVFPWTASTNPNYDGVVLERGASCAPANLGQGYGPYDMNRTAVHEVGHWMGLYHTFQNPYSNGAPNPAAVIDSNKNGIIDAAESSYDCVVDTPIQITPTFGNPLNSPQVWPYTLVDTNGNPVISQGSPQTGTWTCSQSDAVGTRSQPNNVLNAGKPKAWAMFTNYMDYSDDGAMFMFTTDQVNKMRLTLLALRPGTIH